MVHPVIIDVKIQVKFKKTYSVLCHRTAKISILPTLMKSPDPLRFVNNNTLQNKNSRYYLDFSSDRRISDTISSIFSSPTEIRNKPGSIPTLSLSSSLNRE